MSAMADDKETKAGCPCCPAECEAYLVPAEAEAEAVLPLIKGDKGDKMTYADLTAEDKADLIAPIKRDFDRRLEEMEKRIAALERKRVVLLEDTDTNNKS